MIRRTYEKDTRREESTMGAIRVNRRRSPWSTVALAVVLAIMLTACGTNTNGTSTGGTSSDPAPNPAYATIKGYGTTFGCPSDVVVNPLPSAPMVVVTIKQSFATVTVHSGDVIEFRLPFGLAWRGPTASQGPLLLQTPFGYALKDKHVCVWRFVARSAGTTKLIFTARAICKPNQFCPLYVLELRFTIRVQ
jgi:hypothetical protein